MKRSVHGMLAGAALVLAVTALALGKTVVSEASPTAGTQAPASMGAFELAELLSRAPPGDVVIVLDPARHPLRGALPAALFGADDETLVENAPRARRIVLVARDPVRADRVARRLMAGGRSVRVLTGGIGAWDRAMDKDPAAPPARASGAAWQRYRSQVALRRAFGEPGVASAAPVAAPAAPMLAPAAVPVKKREGC